MPYIGPRQGALALTAARLLGADLPAGREIRGIASATTGKIRGTRLEAGHTIASHGHLSRPVLVYFAGALDVCCYGKEVRCAIGRLNVAARGASDVLIRPQLPVNQAHSGPCLKRMQTAMEQAEYRAVGRMAGERLKSDASEASRPQSRVLSFARTGETPNSSSNSAFHGASLQAHGHGSLLTEDMLRRSDRDMASSVFCLIPAGDSAITDRLYAAIASGCLPVVLADELKGAFERQAQYTSFWDRVPMKEFVRRPDQLLVRLRAIPLEEVRRRQLSMLSHRADVLYDLSDSRVGTNFLEEIQRRCLPLLRNETVPPKSGRSSWTRKCFSAAYPSEMARSIMKGALGSAAPTADESTDEL
jgi:hypothetical protein